MALTDANPHLLLRADASAAIGAGHVMRCLALAQAWRAQGGTFSFACRSLGAALEARIVECGGSVVAIDAGDDAALTALAAQRSRAAAVVIDGYQFTTAHERSCREAGVVTLVVDDNGEHQRFESDLVLNQNLHACEELYRNRSERCELLLGLQYLLLRGEFSRGQKRATGQVASTVLLSFGASDIGGL